MLGSTESGRAVFVIRPKAEAFDGVTARILEFLGLAQLTQVVVTPRFGGAHNGEDAEYVAFELNQALKGNVVAVVLIAFGEVHCDCSDPERLRNNLEQYQYLFAGSETQVLAFNVIEANPDRTPRFVWDQIGVAAEVPQ